MDDRGTERENVRRLKSIITGVTEEAKIKLDLILSRFQMDGGVTEYTFPSTLTNTERAYVHLQCGRLGIKSLSNGAGNQRRIGICKVQGSNLLPAKYVEFTDRSIEIVQTLADVPFYNSPQSVFDSNIPPLEASRSGFTNRLSTGPSPKIPKPRLSHKYEKVRSQLPIWNHRQEILSLIKNHKVTFLKGETGCGKTTQVPQFILDDATENNTPVRILCTVPRRIAAVTISDRVAIERGERVGYTVGYQIRLESCYSPCDTLLTYCTSGVLLRSLASMDYSILKNTTHIIIDEVHERDRQTDFLLACLRDVGLHFPNLHLILMGADMDTEMFTSYFGGTQFCPMLDLEGRLYSVNIVFLEDVLELLDYKNYEMDSSKSNRKTSGASSASLYNTLIEKLKHPPSQQTNLSIQDHPVKLSTEEEKSRNAKLFDVDGLIQRVWSRGDEDAIQEFIGLVSENAISVDYQHGTSNVTMLMATVVRHMNDHATTLLSFLADINVQVTMVGYGRRFTAKDWAVDHGNYELVKILSDHEFSQVLLPSTSRDLHDADPRKQERLMKYQASVDDERVDLRLALILLHQIHTTTDLTHAVLVFLPGYDEIVTLKQMLFNESEMRNFTNSFVVFMLHSNIQTGDQKAAFDKPRRGLRKILLATNIAESSLTIEDVVYVIDSGKVKEKNFDSMTGVTQLKSNWISKASANQRQGRAGRCRPGICYRLYSRSRYEFMQSFPTPEIVRSSLQELSLYTRAFIRGDLKIADFFSRLPKPPAPIAVEKAVHMLKAMGALTSQELLTKLGLYLLDFPIEPSLGKALIYAVVLKCLDPVLTIVSVISYRDPFQLPNDPSEKQRAMECKQKFAAWSMSDHLAVLRAFQDWEKSKLFREGTERKFCRDNYVSSACFEMVYGVRAQLLGQLRACGFVRSKGTGDLRDLNVNSDNWAVVKGVLVSTLYPNICGINRQKKMLYNQFESKILVHPSSAAVPKKNGGLLSIPADWIIYDEMCQMGNTRMVRGCTCVGDLSLALFAGSYDFGTSSESNCADEQTQATDSEDDDPDQLEDFKINDWIRFKGVKETITAIQGLRRRLHELVLKKLAHPTGENTERDDLVLESISSVVLYEDEAHGLKNVPGIGQWPKLVSGNLMSAPRYGYDTPDEMKYKNSPVKLYKPIPTSTNSPWNN